MGSSRKFTVSQENRADTPKLSEAERTIYDLIISTEDMGIWTREIKFKIKVIPDTVVNKSIKSLKDKALIKGLLTYRTKEKNRLLSWHKNGVWSFSLDRRLQQLEIAEAVNNMPVFTVKFTGRQIEELVQSLFLDKKIMLEVSTGKGDFARISPGEQCYQRALASIPCGVCPRLNECTPDGIISPTTCVNFKKWLDF
ncbi:hypothetical protein MKW92_029571 [Papaver armeniacum]|nr:hypothetical protein MKW92_029571 [Papaver armeniacum]